MDVKCSVCGLLDPSPYSACYVCEKPVCSHRRTTCLGWWSSYYGITYTDDDIPWDIDMHPGAPLQKNDFPLYCAVCAPTDQMMGHKCAQCGSISYSPVQCWRCHCVLCGTTDKDCAAWDDPYIGAVWRLSHFGEGVAAPLTPDLFVCQACSSDN